MVIHFPKIFTGKKNAVFLALRKKVTNGTPNFFIIFF